MPPEAYFFIWFSGLRVLGRSFNPRYSLFCFTLLFIFVVDLLFLSAFGFFTSFRFSGRGQGSVYYKAKTSFACSPNSPHSLGPTFDRTPAV